ncbi:hypothetical protein, variant [Cryptococcus amylolentus CBS 6039]|uniref:Domain of unknown function at the cortex 1 domain-containing protein n=1 Tax=Cryptococcus amylolentus CBS 6039 TaxID=1295533 RepID=A0A1E3HBB7_9TREE|nr:hypothetical protein, variant [Cryptococcus amylolentus CBS 6039]ODN72741.1 hypothetical protein, variant [Cryptococcus amylolentus CBS 6039]
MAPKLRVLVSTPDSPGYPPTTPIPVNSPSPSPLSTPGFEGHIWVFVKDYSGAHLAGDGAEYFAEEGREGMTYGIVVKGRFREEVGGDEVVFGNVFEKPIRDSLPWGTSVATKFMYFIDPTLELDIYADKPWALSPALATMNYLSLQESSDIPKDLRIKEDAPEYLKAKTGGPSAEGSEKAKITARRKWLGSKANREKVKLNKDVVVGMEFANGLLGEFLFPLLATHRHLRTCSHKRTRLQHPLRHPPTPIQSLLPPAQILGRPARDICLPAPRKRRREPGGAGGVLECGV